MQQFIKQTNTICKSKGIDITTKEYKAWLTKQVFVQQQKSLQKDTVYAPLITDVSPNTHECKNCKSSSASITFLLCVIFGMVFVGLLGASVTDIKNGVVSTDDGYEPRGW